MAKLKINPDSIKVDVVEDSSAIEDVSRETYSKESPVDMSNYVTKTEVDSHLSIYRDVISKMANSIKEVSKTQNIEISELKETADLENAKISEMAVVLDQDLNMLSNKIDTLSDRLYNMESAEIVIPEVIMEKNYDKEIADLSNKSSEMKNLISSMSSNKVVEIRHKHSKSQRVINSILIITVLILTISKFI